MVRLPVTKQGLLSGILRSATFVRPDIMLFGSHEMTVSGMTWRPSVFHTCGTGRHRMEQVGVLP